MRIKLSNHFSYGRLLRFTLPSIIMMIFTSVYGMVDGLFVSNIVGISQFAAINLIMPILLISGAFGFMLGAGGTAIVSQTLGEGKREEANKYFTFITVVCAIAGAFFSVLGFFSAITAISASPIGFFSSPFSTSPIGFYGDHLLISDQLTYSD